MNSSLSSTSATTETLDQLLAQLTGELFDQSLLESTPTDSKQLLIRLRDALKQSTQRLNEWFQQGVPVSQLLATRARLMDCLLSQLWQRFVLIPPVDPDHLALALVAVGGYGRSELHPGSDIDIMILGDSTTISEQQAALADVVTFLWDIGLEIGHSVRTPEDCKREALADITVITNLMEARLICGSEALFERMRTLTGPTSIWPNQRYFEAKKDEQKQRYHKFHETAYNLEPNVKEGPGGLRDIQTIAWVVKRYFGAATLAELVKHDFLTEREYQDLIRCQEFLWQVRFALHAFTNRREDRLLFDYQRQLATQFGYQNDANNLAVEQFMQRYYRTIMEISRLNEMLLQLFEEAILLAEGHGEPVAINRRFQIRKGYLEVKHESIFRRYPFALLELFLILQQRLDLKGVRAATVRMIRDNCHLIDDAFRTDLRARSLFMEILRQPSRVTRALRRMNRYGVLAAYLPAFGKIVGRMQYDLYHVYTVDQHTLFVVRHLRRFYLPRFGHEFPHCSAVMQRLPKVELLYIAGLYHDIAKGRGGDHSELGAVDVEQFCQQHDLSAFDTRLVVWLVRNHLFMSLTAQKKDIQDPEIITEFARFVGDQLHLDYLYLLTVADIRATNPKLWNNWRQSLLRELYEATRRSLRRGLNNPIDKEERIHEVQVKACQRLRRQRISRERILAVWGGFSDDYFLRYSVDEIVWHTRAILKKADDGRALVMALQDLAHGGTEIFIYTRDIGGIFATTTAALDRLGLTVLDARIVTSNTGYILDSFTVVEQDGKPIVERRRLKEILDALRQQLNYPAQRKLESNRQMPRLLKHFQTSNVISFEQDDANQRTILEISTSDRPGLLCRIGRAFIDRGIQLQNAKIATIGARAEDIFYITDSEALPITDAAAQQALREALLKHLAD